MTRGDNATTSSSAIGARGAATSSSSSTTTTLFDARRELAADLQRREAKRAQARAEAAITPDMPAEAVYTITEVYESHVVLDGNHPLAGLALRLHLTVCDVREATLDETEAATVGQPAFTVLNAVQPGPHLH